MAKHIITDDYEGGDRRTNDMATGSWKVVQALFNVLVAITIGIVGWHINLTMTLQTNITDAHTKMIAAIADVSMRVAVIEGNRFTSQDANKALQEINANLNEMNIEFLKAYASRPVWIENALDDHQRQINEVRNKMLELHGGKVFNGNN